MCNLSHKQQLGSDRCAFVDKSAAQTNSEDANSEQDTASYCQSGARHKTAQVEGGAGHTLRCTGHTLVWPLGHQVQHVLAGLLSAYHRRRVSHGCVPREQHWPPLFVSISQAQVLNLYMSTCLFRGL